MDDLTATIIKVLVLKNGTKQVVKSSINWFAIFKICWQNDRRKLTAKMLRDPNKKQKSCIFDMFDGFKLGFSDDYGELVFEFELENLKKYLVFNWSKNGEQPC